MIASNTSFSGRARKQITRAISALKIHVTPKETENSDREFPEVAIDIPTEEDHPDSFFKSMRVVLILAQCFGLLPITGITGPNYTSLKFKWLHWKILYTLFVLGGATFLFISAFILSSKSNFSYETTNSWIFLGSKIAAACFMIQISRKWPTINAEFAEIELKFKKYGDPPKTKLKFKIITAIVMGSAVVEYLFEVSRYFLEIMSCYEHDDFGSTFKTFVTNYYIAVFSLIPYNHWAGVLIIIFQILYNFIYTITHIFLGLISISLSERFTQLNGVLFQIQGKEMPSSYWRTTREDYNELSVLVKKIDVHVQKLIFLSMIDNLYWICLQVLFSLKIATNTFQLVCYFWSLGLSIVKTSLVSFSAASIHGKSKEAKTVFYSIPQKNYDAETQRFLIQVTTDEIALTGWGFFPVTRGLLLTIAGTIMTYEIVLLQFNTNYGVKENPTILNKLPCATALI